MKDVPLRQRALAVTQSPHPSYIYEKKGGNIFSDLTEKERVEYFMQILQAPYPAHFFLFLSENIALNPYFSILSQAHIIPAGPPLYHNGSVLEHLACCMNAVAGDALAVWMALCHDLGKCTTDKAMLPRHIGHESRGEELATELGQHIALPEKFIKAGSLAAKLHMCAGKYANLRPGSRRDLIISVQDAGIWNPFWKLVHADMGEDISNLANKDAASINAVPKTGLSGEAWRDAQCRVLKRYKEEKTPHSS